MINTFSVSFSDNAFQIIHLSGENEQQTLHSGKQFAYTNISAIDQLFCSENINYVSQKISSLKAEKKIENLNLVFTIPFNYSVVKKVCFPHESSKEQKKNQIEWELSANLSDPLNSFKIMIVNENKAAPNYVEATVIAINKEIIKKLSQIANDNNAEISKLMLNCFAIENFLIEEQRFKSDSNYYFLKNAENYIEHHFYSGKQYLLSYVDPINGKRNRDEYIVERSNERYKQVLHLIKKLNNNSHCVLYAYGNGLKASTFESLKTGLSLDVEYASLNNFPDPDSFKYLEAWGSVL